MEEQIEGEWVKVGISNRHVKQVCMQVTIQTSSVTYPFFFYIFKLQFTSIKLYIFLKKLSTLSLKLFFLLKATS